jgi:ABC-type multidrug transport system ATPase subunit
MAAACFETEFPLVLDCDGNLALTFALETGSALTFGRGLYFFSGDNGSGKTSFFNMLALIAGQVGRLSVPDGGGIRFNGEAYNDRRFNALRAAEIREKYFCIFPQKAFFLPVSTRDNYMILNGSDPDRAKIFSDRENPDLLSGGQQQKILMDIVLDEKKPVWFLDEPLANLDVQRRYYFWQTLQRAYGQQTSTLFYIDHWMGPVIQQHHAFRRCNGLTVTLESRLAGSKGKREERRIDIYANPEPERFFAEQIQTMEKESGGLI